ncbi:hypothetical protein HAZT_HAZT005355 [Hyalella azteca]|uniref:Ras-related GTP-binding protein C n=1 Tax=Hyalella azteca TaxID=294128 RepID=A0A6A0GU93_HYAAZ|nr:hypothetical protein HAZT_HAZT005355 [Hyalella azteca]
MASYQGNEFGSSFPGQQPLYGPEYGDDLASGFSNDLKPKILLMGLRRSGKSSIQNVVFHKMSPNETLFLDSTNKITTDDITNTSCVQFKILDFPGQIDFFDPSFDSEKIFGGVGALVFVIDAQDDYIEAVVRLGETVSRVYKINPKLKFEVFIHKVDGLTDDSKIETQRDIHQRASDDLHEASVGIPGLENVHLNFYLTSIYDHSIFEAFSKVNSGIEKAFLFDVSSKIYIATDYSPVDMQSYELCCDMIDVVLDISYIYGMEEEGPDHMSCFDPATYSVIKLNNNTVLLLWEVARYLALVCILREENYDRPGEISPPNHSQYNRKGLLDIFDVKNRHSDFEPLQLDGKSKLNVGQGSSSKLELERGKSDTYAQRLGYETLSSLGAPAPNTAQHRRSEQNLSGHGSVVDGLQQDKMTSQFFGDDDSCHGDALRAEGCSGGHRVPGDGMLRSASEDGARGGAGDGDARRQQASHRPSARYASEQQYNKLPSRANSGGAAVQELMRGYVIRAGGGSAATTGSSALAGGSAVGNTYVMTDDAGMVLVNGDTASSGVCS